MAFNFADAKAQVRRAVHDTLGVPAHIKSTSVSTPEPITARLHEATLLYGDLLDQGYAQTIEAVDRIVLVPSDFPVGVVAKRESEITFDHRPGIIFVLQTKDVSDGPLEEVWQATRKAS